MNAIDLTPEEERKIAVLNDSYGVAKWERLDGGGLRVTLDDGDTVVWEASLPPVEPAMWLTPVVSVGLQADGSLDEVVIDWSDSYDRSSGDLFDRYGRRCNPTEEQVDAVLDDLIRPRAALINRLVTAALDGTLDTARDFAEGIHAWYRSDEECDCRERINDLAEIIINLTSTGGAS